MSQTCFSDGKRNTWQRWNSISFIASAVKMHRSPKDIATMISCEMAWVSPSRFRHSTTMFPDGQWHLVINQNIVRKIVDKNRACHHPSQVGLSHDHLLKRGHPFPRGVCDPSYTSAARISPVSDGISSWHRSLRHGAIFPMGTGVEPQRIKNDECPRYVNASTPIEIQSILGLRRQSGKHAWWSRQNDELYDPL